MIISDKIYIDTSILGSKLTDLCQLFTYANPEYHQKKAQNLSTKDVSQFLYHYKIVNSKDKQQIILPRGALPKVKEFFSKSNIPIRILDNRQETSTIDISLSSDVVLDGNQLDLKNILINNTGGLIESPPGCITGDTLINFNRAKKGFKRTIEQAYKSYNQKNNKNYNWDLNITTYVRSFNGDRIILNPITDIVYSGQKKVYKITLENNRSIKATFDHKIMTKNGWVPLGSLRINKDEVMCDTLKPKKLKNTFKNLKLVSRKEHSNLHSKDNKYNFNQGIPTYSKIKLIEYLGIEDTYDIICENPYRNFVANEIVIHNSGKTITMLGLISELKQKTLILMHELRLLNQWMNEIKNKLNGNFTLKSIGDGKKELGDITVGIINTAYSMIKENPSVFDQFGVLVLDEVQHVPATMFTKVINNIPAKYRIGVTGTVKRKDGKHILIYDMIGNTLKSVSESNLKHRITDFEYKQILTNIDFKLPTVSRWSGSGKQKNIDPVKCLTLLISSDIRNNIILENVVSNINSGFLPLVLSDRVKHCKELYSRLIELGYKTILLIGETRKKLKWEEIRDDNTIDCVVAIGKIASEGLDMPMLSSIHLTCPSSNLPQLKQRIGRVRRHVENKQLPLVYDYVDNLAYYIKTEKDGVSRKIYSYKNSAYNRMRFIKKIKKEYLEGEDTIDK